MPKHRFAKGNPGRPKGSPNKFTTLKDAFIGAFNGASGEEALTKFAKSRNKKAFYHMIAAMLPKEVHMSGAEGTPLIPPIIEVKLVDSDGDGNPKPVDQTQHPDSEGVRGDTVSEGEG